MKLAKPIEKDLKNKKFTKVGKTLGKNALDLVDKYIKYRNFNRNDTREAIYVNAFDNLVSLTWNIAASKSVSKCYKSVEDYNNMYDFLIEL